MPRTNNLGIAKTLNEFRQTVVQRKGPQIAGKYEVVMVTGYGESISCYPLNVVLPGRTYKFYEHDIWGPNRKIPIKRVYSDCSMTFIIYQDWGERSFLEKWMNHVIKNQDNTSVGSTNQSDNQYNDYLKYENVGTIQVRFLASDDHNITNTSVVLKEAYPSSLSQITVGADGSSYPTFNVTFEYNTYEYDNFSSTV
jgi:hypothetical protein